MSEQLLLPERTLDQAADEALNIVTQAVKEHRPAKRFLLVSGGQDSAVLLHQFHEYVHYAVHINTGIGIPQTTEFVREQVASYDLPLVELHPPVPYEELVLNPRYFGGFPGGPNGHRFFYQRLKERCLEQLLRDHRTARGQRFLLVSGVRKAESARRMGYSLPINRKGGQVWVNPLLFWTNAEMRAYRERYEVAVSDVTRNLHMSGECLCGAFAHPGELEEIAFFYPEVALRIRALETQTRDLGLRSCTWGERLPRVTDTPPGPMCSSCTLFDVDAS